ncbi:Uncharacterised protein [Raoultella terrigena]|uniref:D-malate degradation protein R n=1 Tax=Raoultella terrigena TaxID=577 RepID=A0A3P8JJY0_RAOTE|nr:Uncharacterised protein [Raoultella terrigena]
MSLMLSTISGTRQRGRCASPQLITAIRSVLWPKLSPFLKQYPDITIELNSEYASVDIAARGYDAGVRFGMELAQDMISIRIGPDVKNTVVGSADYFFPACCSQHA